MVYLLEQDGKLKQSEAGRALLQYGLKQEYGMEYLPEIAHKPNGKPYFPDHTEIHFNISHARQGILCGIDHSEIGVDIERIIPWKSTLAKRICHEDEWLLVEKEPVQWKKERFLTRIWTAKESFLKCKGTGIRVDLRTVNLSACMQEKFSVKDYYFFCKEGLNYGICVCRKGEKSTLPIIKVKEKDVK